VPVLFSVSPSPAVRAAWKGGRTAEGHNMPLHHFLQAAAFCYRTGCMRTRHCGQQRAAAAAHPSRHLRQTPLWHCLVYNLLYVAGGRRERVAAAVAAHTPSSPFIHYTPAQLPPCACVGAHPAPYGLCSSSIYSSVLPFSMCRVGSISRSRCYYSLLHTFLHPGGAARVPIPDEYGCLTLTV